MSSTPVVTNTLVVTNTHDQGSGSLRDAIARSQSGDTIRIDPSLAGCTLTLTSGQLVIPPGKSLTIDGGAAAGFTISGGSQSRIFFAGNLSDASPTQLTLRHLRLTDGSTAGGGAAVFACPYAGVMVESVEFMGHVADLGGGAIWSSGSAPLTVVDCVFSGNRSMTGNSERGGGAIAYVGSGQSLDRLTIHQSEFYNNRGINGGAINSLNAALTVEQSTFSGNDVAAARIATGQISPTLRGYGGAIYVDRANQTVAIRDSTFIANTARSAGGALHLLNDPAETVVLASNLFQENRAIGLPSGEVGHGGAISQVRSLLTTGTLTLHNSTLVDNTATGQAGGLWVNNTTTAITNTTFSGNRTPTDFGGAMTVYSPTTITNSTLVNNQAQFSGAIAMGSTQLVTVQNTILANNMSTDPTISFNGNPQVNLPLIDAGGNLQSPGEVAIAPGIPQADPQLASLQWVNGTWVHPLQSGSPAINAGVAQGAPLMDSRSIYRDAQPDLGAVEQSVSVDPTFVAGGLRGEYFDGYFDDDLNFFAITPSQRVRTDATINFQNADIEGWGLQADAVLSDLQTFSVQWRGYLQVPTTGQYTFYLATDDASYLYVGPSAQAPTLTNATINNGGMHAAREVSVTVTLTAGFTPILLMYGQNTSGQVAELSWSSVDAGIEKQIIPASTLFTSTRADRPGSFSFSQSRFSVNENGVALETVTVNRLGGSEGTASVTVTPTAGSATAGTTGSGDFSTAPISLTFADGETQRTVVIPVVDDALPERTETLNLTLSNPTNGATLGSQRTAELAIVDDDRIALEITNTAVVEGPPVNGAPRTATITVSLAGFVTQPVTVDYATVEDTAIAGVDYTAVSGQLSFGLGDTTKTITVPILDDALIEPTERFTLRLSNATGAAIEVPDGVILIRDDEGPFRTDFNSDGQTDVFWYNAQLGQTYSWIMDGRSRSTDAFVAQVPDAANAQLKDIQDFNRDGQADLLWYNPVQGTPSIWLMNGTGVAQTVALPKVGVPNWNIVGTADFNGDGNVDILWTNTVTSDSSVWLMNGTQLIRSENLPKITGTGWNLIATTDLTDDQSPDLIWRNRVTGENVIWQMNGTTLVARSFLPTVSYDLNWTIVNTGDFNGDGQTDLLWQNLPANQVAVWYLNGDAYVRDELFVPTTANAKIQTVGDFNGDRIDEILWYNNQSGATGLWYRDIATPQGNLSQWQTAPLPSVGPASGWQAL
jgi:hypothetical protein